jgi:hypothetical protein
LSHYSKLVIRKEVEGIAIAIKYDKIAVKLAYEVEALEAEIKEALRIANELTLETQTIGEAMIELVRMLHLARAQRDAALDELQNYDTYED